MFQRRTKSSFFWSFSALFSLEEYRSLFSDAGVRRKLGERILTCKNFGSHMLDFFETYLADDDPDSILKQKEWRRLRKAAAATEQKDISITASGSYTGCVLPDMQDLPHKKPRNYI